MAGGVLLALCCPIVMMTGLVGVIRGLGVGWLLRCKI